MGSLYTISLSSTKNKIAHIAALLLILALFFIPYKEIRIERIRAFGESSAVGIVIDKSIRTEQNTPSPENAQDHVIKYRFIDPSGLPRERAASVESNFWRRVVRGDSVIVHFAKAEPGVSRIEHEKESSVVRFLARYSRKKCTISKKAAL